MEQILEILGAVTGIIYLWLEYRASIYLWIVGIIMPAIYIYVYYNSGLYANLGINVYYLLVALYGWLMWRYGGKGKQAESTELPIIRTPRKHYLPLIATAVVAFGIIVWVLRDYTDSDVPYLDGFTTSLSIVGMWMLARKYIEQWWVWFTVDVVSVGLYLYKDLYYLAVLYIVYVVVAFFGYRKWKQLMQ
jgi:nicotinamide mononucleotide transporter